MLKPWLCWGIFTRQSGYSIKPLKPMDPQVKLLRNINTLYHFMEHLLKLLNLKNLSKHKIRYPLKSLSIKLIINPFKKISMAKKTH